MTCKDGSISWSITQHSPPSSSPCTAASTTSPSASFPSLTSNLDWSSDGVAVESITAQIRAFPIPCPFMTKTDASNSSTNDNNDNYKTKVTLGDLIDKTPRDRMAKVVVEERMFETWYYCRTILIGDGKSKYAYRTAIVLCLCTLVCVCVCHAPFSSLISLVILFPFLAYLALFCFAILNEACHKVSYHN